MQRRSKTHTYDFGKKIFSLLIFLLSSLLLLYGYFISASIVNVLVREEVERDIADVSSHVSQLESQYLVQKNKITLEYAYTQGFSNITNKQFTARASLIGGLSLNNSAFPQQ